MAKQNINTGTAELAGDGESIRSAFAKINSNFDELYSNNIALTTATTTIVGGVKIGTGISISNSGTISVNTGTTYVLTTATTSTLGGVIIGTGISISNSGTISVNTGTAYVLTTATTSTLGGVIIGTGISISNSGTISVANVNGLSSRITASVTVSSLPPLSATSATITGFKSYTLLSIETSTGSWVTVYSSTATRATDWSRSITTDPTVGSGVIAESITTQSGKSLFTPAVIGFSSENIPTTNIPVKIYNNNTSNTVSIIVTLTLLNLEN